MPAEGRGIRRGMRLAYTGPYDPSVTTRYPPGRAIRVSHINEKVTVRLEEREMRFADWPLEHVVELPDEPDPSCT